MFLCYKSHFDIVVAFVVTGHVSALRDPQEAWKETKQVYNRNISNNQQNFQNTLNDAIMK